MMLFGRVRVRVRVLTNVRIQANNAQAPPPALVHETAQDSEGNAVTVAPQDFGEGEQARIVLLRLLFHHVVVVIVVVVVVVVVVQSSST